MNIRPHYAGMLVVVALLIAQPTLAQPKKSTTKRVPTHISGWLLTMPRLPLVVSGDSATASWAGQLDSFLNTTHDDLLLNIRHCWASLFSDRAISYRIHCDSKDISVAVVVQGMLDSRISGTAFSVHPVTGQSDAILIESCIGLGETLVLGKEMPTTFLVKKDSLAVSHKDIGEQKNGLRRSAAGKGNELFTVDSTMQPLSDSEAQEVARLVLDVEQKFCFPVDVEWAYEGNRLYLLQSRPITTTSKILKVL